MTPPDDERRDADDYLRPHDGSPTPEQPDQSPAAQSPGEQPGHGAPGHGAPGHGAPGHGAPGHGAPGYGAPGYGAPGYGAPGYGAPDYGQQPYPAYGPGYYTPPGRSGEQHPSATTALVLGIVGLVGVALCGGITLLLSPVAWWMGGNAVKEIDAQPGRYTGRDQAQGGRIMGIIGTILLVLGLIAIVLAIVVFAVAVPMGSFEGSVSATSTVLR